MTLISSLLIMVSCAKIQTVSDYCLKSEVIKFSKSDTEQTKNELTKLNIIYLKECVGI
jgi:hypothetical protein